MPLLILSALLFAISPHAHAANEIFGCLTKKLESSVDQSRAKTVDLDPSEVGAIHPSIKNPIDNIVSGHDYSSRYGYFEWTQAYPEARQGYKLHVSATADNAQTIARLILPELRAAQIPHKVVPSGSELVEKWTGTQAGKFITLYPKDAAEAEMIAAKLDRILSENGIKEFQTIAGEKQIGKSGGVFMRWGQLHNYDGIMGVFKTDSAGNILDREGKTLTYKGKLLNISDVKKGALSYTELNERKEFIKSHCDILDDTRGQYKPDWVPDIDP